MKDGLKICKITYTELRSFVEFENCRMEVETIVGPSDDPEEMARELRAWVREQIKMAGEEKLAELDSEEEEADD